MIRSQICTVAVLFLSTFPACAQEVAALAQIPGLKELPDRTQELQAIIDRDGGNLLLVADKQIRITAPLEFDLTRHGAIAIRAPRGTTLIMNGPGPAIRIRGSHQGTASPKSFQPATWNERMPVISGLEILGAHPEADGIELFQTVEPVVNQVSVRWCRHGIHLVERNRNVLISDCHLYENSGVGIYLDHVNLHQINVSNSHISYNRAGGIVVRDGNVRNLQVSGCDIEGNMPEDETSTSAANIWIDLTESQDTKEFSVAEVSITGCTIQHAANYSGSEDQTVAPGGSNIRLAGKEIYPIDSVTITGNVMSDTTTNLVIDHAYDIVVSANTFFAPKPAHMVVTNSQRVVVSGNTFNPRQFERPGTIHFQSCRDCIFSNNTLHRFTTTEGALILEECSGMSVSGVNLSDCSSGIVLRNTTDTSITGCRVTRTAGDQPDVSIDPGNARIALHGNVFTGRTSIATEAISPSNSQ